MPSVDYGWHLSLPEKVKGLASEKTLKNRFLMNLFKVKLFDPMPIESSADQKNNLPGRREL